MTTSDQQQDGAVEPNGREPKLPGYDDSRAPMLGGVHRLWPSIAAYLLSEQYKAHRQSDMNRVWVMRRLRHRLHQRLEIEWEASLYSGERIRAISDDVALAEIEAERAEVKESLDQALRWRRYKGADEQRAIHLMLDEVIRFWQSRLATWNS